MVAATEVYSNVATTGTAMFRDGGIQEVSCHAETSFGHVPVTIKYRHGGSSEIQREFPFVRMSKSVEGALTGLGHAFE